MGYLDEKPPAGGGADPASLGHVLTVTNREYITMSGILSVESFDDQEIALETDLGMLTLRGEDLHIKQLDLESGRFAVEGTFHSCTYAPSRSAATRSGRSKGFFERLLR